jgi:hypothetical protein
LFVAVVSCAGVVVVTDNLVVLALIIREIALVLSAFHIVIAVFHFGATTRYWRKYAFASCLVARILCADIVVIADHNIV